MKRRLPTAEQHRLEADRLGKENWRRWGPYLSDRQWGTVREDYSANGDAWSYLSHDHARSRAYRWGEDGLAGISDHRQRLCLAIGLWNGRDPILKERLFGLNNMEGNHGEDVKEYYYQLDATPSHSYLKFLYKYPQGEFPYQRLLDESRRRTRLDPEFELIDTGLFNDDRYFDVTVEYAKASPDDLVMKVVIENRGPDDAELHLLAQLWYRNTWSWRPDAERPRIEQAGRRSLRTSTQDLGAYVFHAMDEPRILFCENETNTARLYGIDRPGPFKDAFHDALIHGREDCLGQSGQGSKAAFHHRMIIPSHGSRSLVYTLCRPDQHVDPDAVLQLARTEADEFYADLQRELLDPDARLVQRQAFAGMIWNKQFYYYDIPEWLDGDPGLPVPPQERRHGRNSDWRHLNNADVLSMPDKWEYPWFAAWDLAFHTVVFARIDPEFAKDQLVLLTREWYMHPNGQLPAYEWDFGDVNPPVHAWAAWRVFQIDRKARGDEGDLKFLERVFHKLMLNFTWWVNRKDAQGRNIFQGGFLGLDNIGIFDRSAPLPNGGFISQADGTAWMAMYSLNLMKIALELALKNPVYQDIASKFFEHFLAIAEAMTNMGGDEHHIGLWDNDDGFYYDEINFSDGRIAKLKVRSMVSLIPLFAVETIEPELLVALPEFRARLRWYLKNRPNLAALVSKWDVKGRGRRRLLSLLRGHRLKMLLKRMLDETEFLSEHGVRSLSKVYRQSPYHCWFNEQINEVSYQPAESDSGLFGGNSNWRGPVWFPVNFLIIESLQKFHHYYGDDFKIEFPTGSGTMITIEGVAEELTRRLCRIFLRDENGRRAVFGNVAKFQDDPHFRDLIPFYEYFDGDDGRGLGASHQTGWTGLVAKLLHPRRRDTIECYKPAHETLEEPAPSETKR